MNISFDALITETGLEQQNLNWTADLPYLIRDYSINTFYNSRSLLDQKVEARIDDYVTKYNGFGIEYDDYTLKSIEALKLGEEFRPMSRGMGKLFYADDEVIESSEFFKSNYFLNKDATKEKFLQNKNDIDILHIVAHGYILRDDPMNSGIIFSKRKGKDNFILTASEIYGHEFNSDLVILSSCHSGDGKLDRGEGIRSLARAFQYAGCENITASLWQAPDLSTKEIIVSFLDFISQGYTKDVALQKAKLYYLDNKAFKKDLLPCQWAHMVSIGAVRAF